jgi:hypothetical protein
MMIIIIIIIIIIGEVLKKNWENKAMNGQYIRNIDGNLLVNKTRSSG